MPTGRDHPDGQPMSGHARAWSCDTLGVRAAYSRAGATLLGKNSDRPVRESQPLRWYDARRGGGALALAYLRLDDAEQTIPHVGSSPYWCWGHEIGVSAEGVAIGNEALFTRDLAVAVADHRSGRDVETGILGMELVRLGLERGETAGRAVEVMSQLVEQYGQWGAGTVSRDRAGAAYDNSYLVADSRELWVLETSGRHWAARRVDEPAWSLSNEPTIRTDWTRVSPGLERHAREAGWWREPGRVDFAAAFADPGTPLQASHLRLQRSRQLLADGLESGPLGFHELRAVLADHYEGTFVDGPLHNAARPDFLTLCMHAHPSGFTWGNTAASAIAVLPERGRPYLWWAAATPCTSVYVPVSARAGRLPAQLGKAGRHAPAGADPERAGADACADDSYWWIFQRLLEAVAGDELGSRYDERQPVVRKRFDALQERWLGEVDGLVRRDAPEEAWGDLTDRCVGESRATAQELLRQFGAG